MVIRMRRLDVLLVEDNAIKDRLSERYREFFSELGYDAKVDIIRCDIGIVQSVIGENDYHVVVSDLSFGNLDLLEGLKLVKWIKSSNPHIFVIANSGENLPISNFVGVGMDLFIPKGKVLSNDKIHKDWFLKQFERNFRINTELVIEGGQIRENYSARSAREIQRLFAECLFSTHRFDTEFDPARAKLTALTRGFSDSRVFSVISKSSEGEFDHIKAVVKISQLDRAVEELENYNRFVKWTLPYDWRVDVLGSSFGAKYGAICYSFVTGDEGGFNDLEYYIASGVYEKIEYVIDKIMDIDKRKWYKGGVYSNFQSISEYYNGRYFEPYKSDFQACQDIFEKEIQDILDFVPISGRLQSKQCDIGVELPVQGIYSRYDAECQSCIGHGDLHARNIILSDMDQGKIVFIDFQQTGRCHVFEDFIVMESSIRLNYPIYDVGPEKLIELEIKLSLDEDIVENNKYRLIQKIRRRAFEHFPSEDKYNFVFGSMSFSLRLLREMKIVNQPRQNLLVCIVGALVAFSSRGLPSDTV